MGYGFVYQLPDTAVTVSDLLFVGLGDTALPKLGVELFLCFGVVISSSVGAFGASIDLGQRCSVYVC